MKDKKDLPPRELFHGTTTWSAAFIEQQGLQPLIDESYATDNLEMAKLYARAALVFFNEGAIEGQPIESDYAVVVLDGPKSKMRFDGCDWVAPGVPPDAIKRIDVYGEDGNLRPC